jgi:DNA-directed RNA polymerase specialized sigma24 family protein
MADGMIRGILERPIDELPNELRIVFVACVVDGMTPEQFAELFALTSETVEAHPHDAQSSLVEVLIPPIWRRLRWRLISLTIA